MFLAVAFPGQGPPLDGETAGTFNDLMLCERMGWDLDYVESMDVNRKADVLAILDGADKGRSWVQKRRGSTGTSRGKQR